MITNTSKFPDLSTVNGLLPEDQPKFFSKIEDYTPLTTKSVMDAEISQYNAAIASNQNLSILHLDELEYLSADISKPFQFWSNYNDRNDHTRYYPNTKFKFVSNEFQTGFADNWKECVLDLHADENGNIVDGSLEGEKLNISIGNGIEVVNDEIYGNVIQFPDSIDTSNIESISQLPVMVIDDRQITDKLSIDVRSHDENYVAFVFCKIKSKKTGIFTNSVTDPANDITFFERTNYGNSLNENSPTYIEINPNTFEIIENAEGEKISPYKLRVKLNNGTSNGTIEFGPKDMCKNMETGFNLSNVSYPNYSSDNLYEHWTLFSFAFSMNGLKNDSSGYSNVCNSILHINDVKDAFMSSFNNQDNSVDGNFPTILSLDFNDNYANNNPLYENGSLAGNQNYKILPRVHECLRSANVSNIGLNDDMLSQVISSCFDTTRLFVGATYNSGEGFSYHPGMQIKFIKIFRPKKWDAKYGRSLMAKQYWDYCIEPYLGKKLIWSWNADDSQDFTGELISDNSIEGQYLKANGSSTLREFTNDKFKNIPSLLSTATEATATEGNLLDATPKSLTIVVWLSGDFINNSNHILSSGGNDFQITISDRQRYVSLPIYINENSNLSLSTWWIGNIHGGETLGDTIGRNIDQSNSDFNYCSRTETLVKEDWHQIAISWNYPNTENDMTFDTDNARIVCYFDGVPINKEVHLYKIDTKMPLTEIQSKIGTAIQATNTLLIDSHYNYKSIEIYGGDTEKGYFLEDQEIFALWQRDYEKYFPKNRKHFTCGMYCTNRIYSTSDTMITFYPWYFNRSSDIVKWSINEKYEHLFINNVYEPNWNISAMNPSVPISYTPDFYRGIKDFTTFNNNDHSSFLTIEDLYITFDEDTYATLYFNVDDGIYISGYNENEADSFILSSYEISYLQKNNFINYSEDHPYVVLSSFNGYYYTSIVCHRFFKKGTYALNGFLANIVRVGYVYGGIYHSFFDPFEVVQRNNSNTDDWNSYPNLNVQTNFFNNLLNSNLLSNFSLISADMHVPAMEVPNCLIADDLSGYSYESMVCFFDGKSMGTSNSVVLTAAWSDRYTRDNGLLKQFNNETHLYGDYNLTANKNITVPAMRYFSNDSSNNYDDSYAISTSFGLLLLEPSISPDKLNAIGLSNWVPIYDNNPFTLELTFRPRSLYTSLSTNPDEEDKGNYRFFSNYQGKGIQFNILGNNNDNDALSVKALLNTYSSSSKDIFIFPLSSDDFTVTKGQIGTDDLLMHFSFTCYKKEYSAKLDVFSIETQSSYSYGCSGTTLQNRQLPDIGTPIVALNWEPAGSKRIDNIRSRMFGLYHSMRMYYRRLSDEELQKNFQTDVIRYGIPFNMIQADYLKYVYYDSNGKLKSAYSSDKDGDNKMIVKSLEDLGILGGDDHFKISAWNTMPNVYDHDTEIGLDSEQTFNPFTVLYAVQPMTKISLKGNRGYNIDHINVDKVVHYGQTLTLGTLTNDIDTTYRHLYGFTGSNIDGFSDDQGTMTNPASKTHNLTDKISVGNDSDYYTEMTIYPHWNEYWTSTYPKNNGLDVNGNPSSTANDGGYFGTTMDKSFNGGVFTGYVPVIDTNASYDRKTITLICNLNTPLYPNIPNPDSNFFESELSCEFSFYAYKPAGDLKVKVQTKPTSSNAWPTNWKTVTMTQDPTGWSSPGSTKYVMKASSGHSIRQDVKVKLDGYYHEVWGVCKYCIQ